MKQTEENKPQPQRDLIIDNLPALKALSDPLRLQVLDLLHKEPRTVKQIAKELGLSTTKLYYHISQLEEHGIIRVVSTRVVSGIIEKQYQATAHNFIVKRSLFSPGELEQEESRSTFFDNVASTMDSAKRDLEKSIKAGLITLGEKEAGPKFHVVRALACLTPEQAEKLHDRLGKLLEEFDTLNEDETDSQTNIQNYSLMLAFYPVPPPNSTTDDEDEDENKDDGEDENPDKK